MSAFGGLKLTQKGIDLQAKAQIGAELQYTRIGIGDGAYTGDFLTITNLVHQVMSLPISNLSVNGGVARIGSALSNQSLSVGFYLREIGVFATDPDDGEILYAYANAREYAGYIPPAGGGDIIEQEIELLTTVGTAGNVTAIIDSSVFVTLGNVGQWIGPVQDALDDHMAEASAHGATSAATPSRLIARDENGRAQVAAPVQAADIARKGDIDMVQTNLTSHIGSGGSAHANAVPGGLAGFMTGSDKAAHDVMVADLGGATPAAMPDSVVRRDNAGRAKVAIPAAGDDIARKDTVDAHAERTDNPHSVTKSQVGLDNVDNVQQVPLSAYNAHLADYIRQPGYGTTGGSANTYTLTLTPALSAYAEGIAVAIKIHAANTGSSTINVNGLGARNILDSKGNALISGKLALNVVYSLRYNGTAFILQGEGGDYGTATAAQVLTGYTIGTDGGIVAGAMPNRGAPTWTPGTANQSLLAGYYSGGTVQGSPNLTAANIKKGVNIFGVVGSTVEYGTGSQVPLVVAGTLAQTESPVINMAVNVNARAVAGDGTYMYVLINSPPGYIRTLVKYNMAGGQVWSVTLDNAQGNHALVLTDDRAFIYVVYVSSVGTVLRIRTSDGAVLWTASVSNIDSPVRRNLGYSTHSNGTLYIPYESGIHVVSAAGVVTSRQIYSNEIVDGVYDRDTDRLYACRSFQILVRNSSGGSIATHSLTAFSIGTLAVGSGYIVIGGSATVGSGQPVTQPQLRLYDMNFNLAVTILTSASQTTYVSSMGTISFIDYRSPNYRIRLLSLLDSIPDRVYFGTDPTTNSYLHYYLDGPSGDLYVAETGGQAAKRLRLYYTLS